MRRQKKADWERRSREQLGLRESAVCFRDLIGEGDRPGMIAALHSHKAFNSFFAQNF